MKPHQLSGQEIGKRVRVVRQIDGSQGAGDVVQGILAAVRHRTGDDGQIETRLAFEAFGGGHLAVTIIGSDADAWEVN